MKADIENIEQIKTLVNQFYNRVKEDELLAPLFNHVNWEKHLPVMYAFWNNVIFNTGGYSGNPLQAHRNFHQQFPLNALQFERWLKLFNETLDLHFEGTNTETARQRATSIAGVMQIKLFGTSEGLSPFHKK